MRKRKAIYALSALLLLGGVSVVGLTSCGPSEPEPGPGPGPGPVVDTKIDGFTLELSGSSEIVIGETVNAVATSTTEGVDGIFTYEVTSGQDVVSVNDNGTITGLTAGEATITVTCLNLKETVPSSEATKTVSVTVTGAAESTNGNAYNYVASYYEEKLDSRTVWRSHRCDQWKPLRGCLRGPSSVRHHRPCLRHGKRNRRLPGRKSSGLPGSF